MNQNRAEVSKSQIGGCLEIPYTEGL